MPLFYVCSLSFPFTIVTSISIFFFVPIPPSGLLKGGTDSAHQNLFTGLREYYCIGEKKLYDDFCGSSGNNKKKIWECGVGKKWVY